VQIIGLLREQEGGTAMADVCRRHGIRSATFFQWEFRFGGQDEQLENYAPMAIASTTQPTPFTPNHLH